MSADYDVGDPDRPLPLSRPYPMYRILTPFLSICTVISAISFASADQSHQYYEVRSYVLGQHGDAAAIDEYLSKALLPALGRQQVGPVGVFTNSANDATGSARIVVVVPYNSADEIVSVHAKVESDAQYQADAKDYLSRAADQPPYQRISSELLVAMRCMPALKVPDGVLKNDERVYELRVYESATERLGNAKVDMFNSGEVPIFLDCGIIPIFIGKAVIGHQTPNLTYLTMYPNEKARIKAWQAFVAHPDWLVLKDVAKYQNTVSRIDKFILVPKSYSQM